MQVFVREKPPTPPQPSLEANNRPIWKRVCCKVCSLKILRGGGRKPCSRAHAFVSASCSRKWPPGSERTGRAGICRLMLLARFVFAPHETRVTVDCRLPSHCVGGMSKAVTLIAELVLSYQHATLARRCCPTSDDAMLWAACSRRIQVDD